MEGLSEYEQLRDKNVEENRRMLIQLGLIDPEKKEKRPAPHNSFVKRPVAPVKRKRSVNDDQQQFLFPRRRSLRQNSNDSFDVEDNLSDSINEDYASSTTSSASGKEKLPKKPNKYGEIEGVNVGDWWLTRMECSAAGIHRPTIAGIHPGPEGAYSIALSGGYEDNYDGGECFTYTGAGGRDLKGTKGNPKNLRTAPQSKDQCLEGANASLAASVTTKNPVRVIRGYKLQNDYAPEEGYRYDGLYQVEKYWTATGSSGFLVYKFALRRCKDQDPLPWISETSERSSGTPSDNVDVLPGGGPDCHKPKVQQMLPLPYVLLENSDKLIYDNVNNNSPVRKRLKTIPSSAEATKLNGFSDTVKTTKMLDRNNIGGENNNKHFLENNIIYSTSGILASPKKKNNNVVVEKRVVKLDSGPYKVPIQSPVKMTAQNQLPYLSPSTSQQFVVKYHQSSSSSGTDEEKNDSIKSAFFLKKRSPRKQILGNLEVEVDFEGDSKSSLAESSPSIPFVDDLSFLNGKRELHTSSGGFRQRGLKGQRPSSPDVFAMICDELCNDLPTGDKAKKIKFSFDNLVNRGNCAAQDNNNDKVKQQKKLVRTPRKGLLVKNRSDKQNRGSEARKRNCLPFQKILSHYTGEVENGGGGEDALGWDLEGEDFVGWSESEIVESREIGMRFSDFLFRLREHSEENTWSGWNIVSRRSIILNGFLIEKLSREKTSDSGRDSEEFLGF